MDAIKKRLSVYFFYLLFGVAIIATFLLIRPFLSTIVLAFLTTFLFHRIYLFFRKRVVKKDAIASALSLVTVLLAVILPLILVVNITVVQVGQFAKDFAAATANNTIDLESVIRNVNAALNNIPGNQIQLTPESIVQNLQEAASQIGRSAFDLAVRVGGSSFEITAHLFVYLFLLYTLFPLQERILHNIAEASPMDDKIDQLYINRVLEMSKSMIKGTFTISLVQAVAGGLLLLIFGFKYILFFTMIMLFLGIIPVVGASLVLIPAGLYLIATGSIWQGAILIILSLFFVGNIDNILRPYLVSKQAELHPALVLLGVLGGLQLFGVLGFIYGPVIMIILTTTIEIYYKHYRI